MFVIFTMFVVGYFESWWPYTDMSNDDAESLMFGMLCGDILLVICVICFIVYKVKQGKPVYAPTPAPTAAQTQTQTQTGAKPTSGQINPFSSAIEMKPITTTTTTKQKV